MKWSEIRNTYPDQWLVVEALEAHTFEINGILGMDCLTRARTIIDLGKLTIAFTD